MVFISYSHDSPEHEAKVLEFANRLRSDGVDAVLDQYESFPPGGWIQWMKRQVRDAEFILVVCTETYARRWDGDEKAGAGLGATYEGQGIQQLLYESGGVNERFVPVVLGTGDNRHFPLELRKYTHFPVHTSVGYMRLYRLLTNQPSVKKPILGKPLELRNPKPDFRNLVFNAPSRNPFFTGRAAHLEAVRNALLHTSQPQAISGLGGIGKTQTAIEYAHVYRAQYQAVLWIGAENRDTSLSGFAAIASLLNLPQKDDKDLSVVAAAVRSWLESNSGWLLVLDNVDDLALVREFVPAGGQGHLLMTTKLRATGDVGELLELTKMSPDEGAFFLLRRAKIISKDKSLESARDVDRHVARQISIEVDGLPLALDQAGAFVEETPSSLTEYLALHRSEGRALRARRGNLATGHDSVTITFSLAFARVAEANPGAADLVRGCAFMAPDAIPEEIFTQSGSEWGELLAGIATKPFAWFEAVAEACRFALIHRDVENKSFHIHRLVQDVVKDQMSPETRREWAERVVGALNEVFPTPEFQDWAKCERLLAHARVAARLVADLGLDSMFAARLLNESAAYLEARAQYAEAEPMYLGALAIREKVLGLDHSLTATSLNNLGWLYRWQGRYREAEPLYARALAIHETKFGLDHSLTAQSLSNLAGLYRRQGRYGDAEPLYFRALAIREKALGPDHPDTALCLNSVAALFQNQGRLAEAEPIACRALAVCEKALGSEHPHTSNVLNNLGALFHSQGRHSEAEPLFRRALSIRQKEFGPDHPKTGNVLNNLAALLHSQGNQAEAEPLFRRALGIYEKALGPDHPDIANSLRYYAEVLRKLGRGEEAEKLEARAKAREVEGRPAVPSHPY